MKRVTAWLDGLQRRHPLFGFPIAVGYKFADDSVGTWSLWDTAVICALMRAVL